MAFVSVVLKRDQLSSTAKFCGAEASKFSAESDMDFLSHQNLLFCIKKSCVEA